MSPRLLISLLCGSLTFGGMACANLNTYGQPPVTAPHSSQPPTNAALITLILAKHIIVVGDPVELTIHIAPFRANIAFCVSVSNEEYNRQSCQSLDGIFEPRSFPFSYPNVGIGEYHVSATLYQLVESKVIETSTIALTLVVLEKF